MGYGFIFPVWRLRWIWTRIIFPVKIPNNIIFITFFSIILKHLQIKMLTLNCKSYLQNCSMLWRSNIFIKLVFYIVTFVYWNIVCTESCMYKSILRKINKLHTKKTVRQLAIWHIWIIILLSYNLKLCLLLFYMNPG